MPIGSSQAGAIANSAEGPADLSGVDLRSKDLAGADLRDASLIGADLRDCSLRGADLTGAKLVGANLEGADLTDCLAANAVFGQADLTGAVLFGADLTNASFSNAIMHRTDLRVANLDGARLLDSDLTDADFSGATVTNADLNGAKVTGAHFRAAELRNSRVSRLVDFDHADWIGVSVVDIDFSGAYLLRREIMDQNYLFEFRTRDRRHAVMFALWKATSNCGQSLARWGAMTVMVALVFGVLYTIVDIEYGANRTTLSPLYFSVVTITTLGYGDALPKSTTAQVLVMAEVAIGYMMLGGVLSIFATRMGRRAD